MIPGRLKKRTLKMQEERLTRNVKIIIRNIYQAGRRVPSRERAGFSWKRAVTDTILQFLTDVHVYMHSEKAGWP